MRALTLVTPPSLEPVTLDEAKSWAGVDDSTDDPLTTQLIAAARLAAEQFTRRSFITQSWKLTLDRSASSAFNNLPEGTYDLPPSALYGDMPRHIRIPKGPLLGITSVTTYDTTNTGTVLDSSNYQVDTAGARLILGSGVTWPSNLRSFAACEILYTAGYGATGSSVPQGIKTAIMIHVATLYEQRGQCEDAMALPPGTQQLLNQYRIMGDHLG